MKPRLGDEFEAGNLTLGQGLPPTGSYSVWVARAGGAGLLALRRSRGQAAGGERLGSSVEGGGAIGGDGGESPFDLKR